jgi:hypothetical protein
MIKDPTTKIVINRDVSHHEAIKLRRIAKREAKKLQNEINHLNIELAEIKRLLLEHYSRESDG